MKKMNEPYLGPGLLVLISGILLMEVLSNIFVGTVDVFSYIFLPLPLLGVFMIFRYRGDMTLASSRLAVLSMFIMVLFFVSHILLAGLYQYHTMKGHTDSMSALLLLYYSTPVLLLVGGIIAGFSFKENACRYVPIVLIIIFMAAAIISLLILNPGTENMVEDIDEIRSDDSMTKSTKETLINRALTDYNNSDEKYFSGIPFVISGLISSAYIFWQGRPHISSLFRGMRRR